MGGGSRCSFHIPQFTIIQPHFAARGKDVSTSMGNVPNETHRIFVLSELLGILHGSMITREGLLPDPDH